MLQSLPLVLVPGLLCSARLYGAQIARLWQFGQVAVADHRRDDDMAGVAARILSLAPPRFALAGLSMGGYIAFAMMRLAPERIVKLALLDTSARPDMPESKAGREKFIAMAEAGKLSEVVDALTPRFLHRSRQNDEGLKQTVRDMAAETGAEAFVRQTKAIMSRQRLRAHYCPRSAVRRSCWRERATNSHRPNWRRRSPVVFPAPSLWWCPAADTFQPLNNRRR